MAGGARILAISLESLSTGLFSVAHVSLSNFFLEWAVNEPDLFHTCLLQLLAVTIYMLLEACLLKRAIYYASAFHIFSSIFPISWLFSKGLVVLSTVISVTRLPAIYRVFFT